MATKVKKKAVKKKATKVATKKSGSVVLTAGQAKSIQAFLAKKNKTFKFLDTKISALKA